MTNYKNIPDRSYRRDELSSRFPNISEKEKFRKEVIGEIAVWHTPEEVYEVYQRYHQQGETVEAILSSIKFSEIRQREALNRQTEIIGSLSNLQVQSEENRKEFGESYRELERSIEKIDIKIDEGEEPILTEINHRTNRQFRTNFTPLDLIPWVVLGIVVLICFGMWFASRKRRVKASNS